MSPVSLEPDQMRMTMYESCRPWLAVLNAFPTLSCILFKLKHSWNTHQTFILLILTGKSRQLSSSFDGGFSVPVLIQEET
jgi:hypothetical protein